MIQFRKDQIDAFRSVADTDFERLLARRLIETFPRSKESHGEAAIAGLARLGLERARKLGLDREEDILRYLGVMLLVGSEFERDPQLRWAATALAVPAAAPAPQRVAVLWEQTRAYCNRVMGANQHHHAMALRSLEGKTVETLIAGASRSSNDLLMLLTTMHPLKVQDVGASSIHDLTRFAVETCRTHEILDRESVALMTVLLFLFGAGMMSDPLTVWAQEALKEPQTRSAAQRLAQLLAASIVAAGRIAK